MYLTDLAFIEEGTPNFTEEGLVNFSKMRMVNATLHHRDWPIGARQPPLVLLTSLGILLIGHIEGWNTEE